MHIQGYLVGIKSVRFSSKIKGKNQERYSVLYTELASIPKSQWTASANQECCSTTELAKSQL